MPESNYLQKSTEQIIAPEQFAIEPEKPEPPARFEQPKFTQGKKPITGAPMPPFPATALPPVAPEKIQLKDIERILSEDLEEIYGQLPPAKQQEFKLAGEATARKIKELLERTKVKVKKIAKLVWRWLKIIPGVNKFFLEKESKIKTDNILRLKQDKVSK